MSSLRRLLGVALVGGALLACAGSVVAFAHGDDPGDNPADGSAATTTPIKHLED